MSSCPYCKKVLKSGAKFCTGCGKPVPADSEVETKLCPKCGAVLKAKTKFCTACGATVAQFSADNVKKNVGVEPNLQKDAVSVTIGSSPSNSYIKIIGAIAAVFVAVFIIAYFGVVGEVKAFVVSRFFSPVEDFYQSQFEYEKIIDVRDKQKYHAIKIGDQFWIAQNMNYATESSVCDSCELYGRLYTHEEALNVCPEGFVLPSYWDYKKLKRSLQGTEKWFTDKGTQGTKLWFSVKGVSGGIDTLGFAAIPSGFFSNKDSVVRRRGDMAGYWTADYDRDYALRLKIDIKNDLSTIEGLERDYGFAVRCIKRESSVQNKEKTLLIDGRNSKYYRTTTIGGVRWMAQNLDYKVEKSWCLNDDDSMCGMLGRLYAWDAAQTACPSGWHLPRKSELDSLVFAVGGKSVAGLALKMLDSWNGDSATDSYLFSAFPVGFRDGKKGTYENGMTSTHFWSSSEATKSSAYALELEAGKNSAQVRTIRKDYGVSVRCVEGDPDFGVVVDSRDGKKYKFVKIGNQVWMAENLNYKTKLGEETGRDVCYSNLHGQHAFLYEDALNACPDGWHLPTDEDWVELVDYAQNACGNIDVTGCLAKGIWGQMESDQCSNAVEGEYGETQYVEDQDCLRRGGYRLEASDRLSFGAVGFMPDDFVLGSECREGCGGPVDSKHIANFWSASKKILTIDMMENLPTLKLHEDPTVGMDDCSDGFGGSSMRTEFSLKNVGKMVASVRCIKD